MTKTRCPARRDVQASVGGNANNAAPAWGPGIVASPGLEYAAMRPMVAGNVTIASPNNGSKKLVCHFDVKARLLLIALGKNNYDLLPTYILPWHRSISQNNPEDSLQNDRQDVHICQHGGEVGPFHSHSAEHNHFGLTYHPCDPQ